MKRRFFVANGSKIVCILILLMSLLRYGSIPALAAQPPAQESSPVGVNASTAKRIQSFDMKRTVCEASFVSGAGYSVARNTLAAQGFTFGTGVSVITPEALIGVDIFV